MVSQAASRGISFDRVGDTREQRPATNTVDAMVRNLRQADAARDAKAYRMAAALYEQVLELTPNDAAIHIQCGHMFKEAGELARAEQHYKNAQQLTPNDPDLMLQFGHFYKITARLQEAEVAFQKAAELNPDWPEPDTQLAEMYRCGWRNHFVKGTKPAANQNGRLTAYWPEDFAVDPAERKSARAIERGLIPEIAPRPRESLLHAHEEEIQVRALGRRERTRWGTRHTLRGADAIRGYCISAVPIIELRVMLNGLCFCITSAEGFELKRERCDRKKRKYVFNIWYDFSNFVEGLYDLEFHLVDNNRSLRVHREQVLIAAPLSEDEYPASDRLVSASAPNPRALEEQINSRPSMIRPARRALFATPPRNVLILRVDQLGDMVISIPALRRLRELLPEARFVGLLSVANAEFARTLNFFDEIIAIEFHDSEWERRRVMPLDKQHELRRRLEAYKFEVAIDLAESDLSRPLLRLSGAPFLVGFTDGRSPWLSASYETYTSDPLNDHLENVPHSRRPLALVEAFGTLLSNHAQVIRRDDLARDRLVLPPYGLSVNERFAVLHSGSRVRINRWPHYDTLATMILGNTDLNVVMISDEPRKRSTLPRELAASKRFRLLDQRLPFDDFDALLSFCTVFVGNNSGPSHLASLRGANVVMIYLARNNWREFGHENQGYIISRRVPCAGCNVERDPEECGKGFACITNITPEEVFRTVMEFV
jgi:ADP-heptose:LPS heptosyltransferase